MVMYNCFVSRSNEDEKISDFFLIFYRKLNEDLMVIFLCTGSFRVVSRE